MLKIIWWYILLEYSHHIHHRIDFWILYTLFWYWNVELIKTKQYLESLSGLLVRGVRDVDVVDGEQAVPAAQLAGPLGGPAGQQERHVDAVVVLAAHDVEAEPLRPLL